MKKEYNFINDIESVNLDIHLKKEFGNIFDLAYTLVDLQSVLSTFFYICFKEYGGSYLQTTNRNFNKQFSDTLKLKNFHSGTFTGELTTSVISGLVLKFLEKAFFPEQKKSQNNINVTVNVNINAPITVNIHNFNGNNSDFNRKVNEIIDQTQIVPGNIELSIENFLDKLKESGIIDPHHYVYTREGIKELSKSISRLGKNFDIRA